MPVLVPLAIGAAAGAVAVSAGAAVATAVIVGAGAAILSHTSGVAGWVYDEVVKPVGKAVENVLTSDVGQFVVKAAAALTGNAWAIPLIDGAATIANGGSFGDALKSAAISYVGGKVGQLGGELASQAMVNAGASEFATQVVSSAAGSGAGRASVALVMGQDPVQAFIQGGITGGLGAAAGWLETNTEGAFSKLPPAARNVITSGLSAALTGKELTPDLIWNSLLTSEGVTKTVNNFLGDNLGLAERLSDNQLSALTLGIQRTAAAAFSGGDVPAAVLNQLSQYGEKEFGEWLDDSKFGDAVNNTFDKITGDYQRAEAQAKKMDEVAKAYNAAFGNYEATVNEINTGVAEQERLRTLYDRALQNFQANENQENADALVAAVDAFNAHVNNFNERYTKTLKPNLDRLEKQVLDFETQFQTEADRYAVLVDDLSVSADRVAEDLKPVYNELDKQFVRFMDPNFNEADYRQIAGLDADDDAYLHWLTTGKEQGLPTNMAAYQEEYGSYQQNIINSVLQRAGLSLTDMTNAERAAFLADIDERYPTLQDLRNAPTQTLADELLTNQSIADRADARGYVAGQTQITPEINAALQRAGVEPGMVGEYLTQADITALRQPRAQTGDEIGRQDGITDEDIATGAASVVVNDSGMLEWGRIELNVPYWDNDLGRLVRRSYSDQGTALDGGYTIVDALTGERVDNVLRFELNPIIFDTMESDPGLFLQTVGNLSEAAGAIIDTQVGQAVSEFARNVVERAKESPAIMNTAGIALEAGGELLDTFNNLVLLANINPESTPLGALARDMLALGGDMKTDEWNAAVDRMNARMAEGEGWEKVASVWGGFQEAPVQFLAEIIGKEILQEIPILLTSGGIGNVTKQLLSQAGEEVARNMATRAAIGTAATLDLAESFGGAAGSAYDEAFATAVNSGMSEAQAEVYARDVAISAGMVGATTTLVSMGLMGGNAFERSILARDDSGITAQAFDLLARRVSEGASVTWKEGVQESIEEGLPTLFTETVLTQIDPDRDVLGSVLQAATLGAVAGAGTAGGIYTGYATADALIRTNAAVRNAIAGGGSDPAAAKAALASLGLTDEVAQNNLLSTVNDQFHSNGDVSRAFSAHPDFRVANSDILNGVLNSAGQDVTTYINTYVDQRYVDIEEVKAAAAAEGVTLTDEQARDYVTQTDDPNATQAVLYSIQQRFDPQAVTEQEAREAFQAQGFDPTDEQVAQFVREGEESGILSELSQFVDVNQVTEEEARQYFADIGYNPTDAEVAQFVRQQAETEVQAELETYVDPRMVDLDEVRDAYTALGLSRPTQADLEALIGQYDEADLLGRAETNLPNARYNSIVEQIENLAANSGSSPEVMEALEAVKSDLQGQMEALGFKFDEATGEMLDAIAASEDRLMETIAANEEAGMSRDEAIQEAIATLAGELGTTEETLLERIGETEESLNNRIADVETSVEDLETTVENVESSILDRVQELEDAGIQRDEALGTALAELATELGVTEESLLEQIGQTEEELLTQIGGLESQLGDVEASILDRVDDMETAGISRDEALSTAIGDLATELGLTEEALLDQLGLTEETLRTEIGAAEERLGTQFTDDMQFVANLVGKPARDVTQVDIDFVADLIAQQEVITDLTMAQRQYDVTGDGQITQDDFTLLEQALAGTDVTFAPGSIFGPATGLYAQQEQNLAAKLAAEAETQSLIDQQIQNQTELATQLQTQLQTQDEMARRRAFGDFVRQQQDVAGQRVDVRTPDPMRINYLYDFQSIFANPQQASLFPSPYAEGGQVEDTTDKLLRIIGDLR